MGKLRTLDVLQRMLGPWRLWHVTEAYDTDGDAVALASLLHDPDRLEKLEPLVLPHFTAQLNAETDDVLSWTSEASHSAMSRLSRASSDFVLLNSRQMLTAESTGAGIQSPLHSALRRFDAGTASPAEVVNEAFKAMEKSPISGLRDRIETTWSLIKPATQGEHVELTAAEAGRWIDRALSDGEIRMRFVAQQTTSLRDDTAEEGAGTTMVARSFYRELTLEDDDWGRLIGISDASSGNSGPDHGGSALWLAA